MNPESLKYTKDHEWVGEVDGLYAVGITDHAQELLGDVTYVELPEVGTTVESGEELAVVESVKAASDIYAPVGGTVAVINEALEDAPESVNQNPYGEGWFFKLKDINAAELDELMDAAAYGAYVSKEDDDE